MAAVLMCRTEQNLMHDRTRSTLSGNGANAGRDDATASRPNLDQQADTNPANLQAAAPQARSVEIGGGGIGKEGAALNVDSRPIRYDDSVQRVRGADEEGGEWRKMAQADTLFHHIAEPPCR